MAATNNNERSETMKLMTDIKADIKTIRNNIEDNVEAAATIQSFLWAEISRTATLMAGHCAGDNKLSFDDVKRCRVKMSSIQDMLKHHSY